jgi:hypothetical protein
MQSYNHFAKTLLVKRLIAICDQGVENEACLHIETFTHTSWLCLSPRRWCKGIPDESRGRKASGLKNASSRDETFHDSGAAR